MRTFSWCVPAAVMVMILGLVASSAVAQSNRGKIGDSPAVVGQFEIKGKYWALLIGVESYDDPSIDKLSTPIRDITELAQLLQDQYGFEKERMTILQDKEATRANIEEKLYLIGKQSDPEDSVFIYYAGHGENDSDVGRGFWIPWDGKRGSRGTWINNAVVRENIGVMRARHVYVVVDSCFSGTLFAASRSVPPSEDDKLISRMHMSKSRWGLTSGGNEPVADSGRGGHSIFAYYFLKMLRENERTYLTPDRIAVELPTLVSRNAAQTPKSHPLQSAGDEGGQFIFYRKSGREFPKLERPEKELASAVKLIQPLPAAREGATAQWHHSTVGSLPIPYDWFEVLLTDESFVASLNSIGMLLGESESQTGRLPFGLTKTESSVSTDPLVGVTCAFCHTGRLVYRGTTHRIDGGASVQFLNMLTPLVSNALAVKLSKNNFPDFATKVFARRGQPLTEENLFALQNQIRILIRQSNPEYTTMGWGPGRYDLFGQAANMTSVGLDKDNYRAPNAPVSISPVWGSSEYYQVLWTGSEQHPLSRSLMHVLALNAPIVRDTQLEFSLDVHSLAQLVDAAKQVRPPRWPSHFPPINLELAARGKDLYHGNKAKGIPNLCAHCHDPYLVPKGPFSVPRGDLLKVPLSKINTDSLYLQNIATRKVSLARVGIGTKFASQALDSLTTELMAQSGFAGTLEGENLDARSSTIVQYPARPLLGIWATAPFLHNGSVPNLYELLSPVSERSTCFTLGPHTEFDPERVGFAAECNSVSSRGKLDSFTFVTDRAGNSNEGHEFKDSKGCEDGGVSGGLLGCKIPHEDRRAIIEYLKTCDLERMFLLGGPVCHDLD